MEQGRNSLARRAGRATPPDDDRRTAPDRRFTRRGAAHDARLALATVRALLATQLERDPALPDDTVACLRDASFEVDRLALLLAPDAGDARDRICDVAAVARDVARAHQAASGVPVRCLGRATLAAGDALTMWRVLANLVDNACRAATTVGGAGSVTVVVSTDDARSGVVVDVADTGPGFGSGWVPGVGIDVVTCLVEELGGSLDVDRGTGGTGTRVRIELPGVGDVSPAASDCVTA